MVLWLYGTTKSHSTGEAPFTLAYRTEVVIPIKISQPTPRILLHEPEFNDQRVLENLDLLEACREEVHVKIEASQQHMARSFNK